MTPYLPFMVSTLVALLGLGGCFQPQRSAARRESLLREIQRSVAAAKVGSRKGSATLAHGTTLDVEAAVVLAADRHPDVQRAKSDEAIAAAQVERASQLRNPQLRLRNIEISRVADEGLELELALRVPVPQPWLLHARVQREKSALAAAKARRQAVQREVRRSVRQLFARLAHVAALETNNERLLAQTKRLRERAKEALAQRTLTAADALVPRLRHGDALEQKARLTADRLTLEAALTRAVGASGAITFTSKPADLRRSRRRLPRGTSSTHPAPAVVTVARPAANANAFIAKHPTQRLADARLDVARADRYIAKASRWPWLRFAEVSYLIQPDTAKQRLQLYVGLEIPLFSLNGGGVALAEARLERRKREQRSALREALRQSAALRARINAARRRLETLDAAQSGLDKARELLEATSKQGPQGLLRATSVAWRLHRAERQRLDAELALRLAQLALDGRQSPPRTATKQP